MSKLRRCPSCGRSHAGFLDLCPDCYKGIKAGVAALNEGRISPWEEVKKEIVTPVTKRRGRPRQYRNDAERQAAYRSRKA